MLCLFHSTAVKADKNNPSYEDTQIMYPYVIHSLLCFLTLFGPSCSDHQVIFYTSTIFQEKMASDTLEKFAGLYELGLKYSYTYILIFTSI